MSSSDDAFTSSLVSAVVVAESSRKRCEAKICNSTAGCAAVPNWFNDSWRAIAFWEASWCLISSKVFWRVRASGGEGDGDVDDTALDEIVMIDNSGRVARKEAVDDEEDAGHQLVD